MSGSIDSASTPGTVSVREGKRDGIVASVQIKESVKDHVFPYAKFLGLHDLPYTADARKKTWCHMMARKCNIQENQIEIWWGPARKLILKELGLQRSTKTNTIKREFFGKLVLSATCVGTVLMQLIFISLLYSRLDGGLSCQRKGKRPR